MAGSTIREQAPGLFARGLGTEFGIACVRGVHVVCMECLDAGLNCILSMCLHNLDCIIY